MPYTVTAVIPAHVYNPKKPIHSFHAEQGNPMGTTPVETGPGPSSVTVTARSRTVAATLESVLKALFEDVTVEEVEDTVDNTDSTG